jgi:hypothetical protein
MGKQRKKTASGSSLLDWADHTVTGRPQIFIVDDNIGVAAAKVESHIANQMPGALVALLNGI